MTSNTIRPIAITQPKIHIGQPKGIIAEPPSTSEALGEACEAHSLGLFEKPTA